MMPLRSLRIAALTIALLAPGAHLRAATSQAPELPAPEAWAALDRGDAEKAAGIFPRIKEMASHSK